MLAPVQPPRTPRRALDGVLVLDKPLGWSSNDALQKAKGLLRALKGGHTGTLDPLATGVLPLAFGAATKFSQASLDADKRYRATLALGQRTRTGDREGEVIETLPVPALTPAAIESVLARHTGLVRQVPPMHSALKHEGRALYEYARAGQVVERAAREVTIHSIAVEAWDGAATLVLDVRCSKGTYIRTLAEDIGASLGCGAHLSALRRTASGLLVEADAVTIEQLAALPEAERAGLLRPLECLVQDLPAIDLEPDEAARFLCGQRRRVSHADAPALRVFARAPRAFIGTAHVSGGELIADRLLNPLEVQPQR